jgi:outer membrane protein assembly factor BamA
MMQSLRVAWLLVALQLPQSPAPEIVAEVRVHGNHTTPDTDVLEMSGMHVGEPATDDRLRAVERTLLASGRFAGVEVRKRFRSLEDPSAIVIIIVVDELPGVSEDIPMPGPMRKLTAAGMWLPVIRYDDGYGFTYGARVSFVDVVGRKSRISAPLTWGGERRATLEVERQFDRGPITRLTGVAGVTRRENPHFEIGDLRQTATVRAERAFTGWLRAGLTAGVESVSFGERDERQWTSGADLVFDTRLDPAFPRNAVHARVGWQRLHVDDTGIGRWSGAFDGYLGLPRASVLAIRAQALGADGPLPPWEQALLGGTATLRGYRAGYRAGDNLAALSAELRVPLTSPLQIGRFGARAFVDTGTTWAHGEAARRSRWDRGVGVGVFLTATVFGASLDVAWPESGGPRWHVGLGVSF